MGDLLGKCLMPRVTASLGAPYWSGVGLLKFTAMVGSESDHFVGAINQYPNGSFDSGLCQINLSASESPRDKLIRSVSLDEKNWRPAAEANVQAAHGLYLQPMTRHGKPGKREWQPWYGYTTPGWAMFPEWWVWSQSHESWLPTGHYLQRAIAGVANYHLVIAKSRNRNQALFQAKHFADQFHVEGELGISEGIVAWTSIPQKPKEPPADGIGPRPRPNDGH